MSSFPLVSLLKAPVFEDSKRTRVARYLYYILLITGFGTPIFMLVPFLAPSFEIWNTIICTGIFLICMLLLFLIRLGYVQLASISFIGGLLISILLGGLTTNGIRTPGLLAIPTLLTVCSLLLGNRATLLLGGFSLVSITGLFLYGRNEVYVVPQLILDINYFSSAVLVIIVTVLILHFTVNRIVQSEQQNGHQAQELTKLNAELQQQAQELIKLNAELQLEMSARVRTERILYQEQKLESIGLLVGGIAHDFNNLFTSALGQAALAQRHLTPDHKAYRHLEKSAKATQQAAELTRQLLAYTGKSNVQSEPLDLNQLIQDNQELLDTAMQQNTALILELQPDLPTIEAAPGQLQQVIMNLLINAAQAITHRAGQITVTTRAITLAQAPDPFDFVGPAPAAGEYVKLTVQDNGSGMPQAVLDRIFDPYFTTKDNGNGLGLSAVLGIIQAHQGSLQVTSTPGQGSCFHLYLPTSRQASLSMPTVNSTLLPTTDAMILVIEDQEEVSEATIETFHSAGYRTLKAMNGYEGVALFQQHAAEIDVVLLDILMPGMNGIETLEQLRAIDATAKVILTSGYSEHTLFAQMQRQRPTDFLPKPYLSDTLLSRVATVLSLQQQR